MLCTLTIDCDNSAFQPDDTSRGEELKRIFTTLATLLGQGYQEVPTIYDVNGGNVGSLTITQEKPAKWEKVKVQYGELHGLYLGNTRVAQVANNPCKPKGEVGKNYVARFLLPVPTKTETSYKVLYSANEVELQHAMELYLQQWLAKTGLRIA